MALNQVLFMNRTLTSLLICVSALSPVSSIAQSSAPSADALERARIEMERNHWPEAFELLARLADQGDAEASRLAWQMWRYGSALYGQRFEARKEQVERWSQACACVQPAKRP